MIFFDLRQYCTYFIHHHPELTSFYDIEEDILYQLKYVLGVDVDLHRSIIRITCLEVYQKIREII